MYAIVQQEHPGSWQETRGDAESTSTSQVKSDMAKRKERDDTRVQ